MSAEEKSTKVISDDILEKYEAPDVYFILCHGSVIPDMKQLPSNTGLNTLIRIDEVLFAKNKKLMNFFNEDKLLEIRDAYYAKHKEDVIINPYARISNILLNPEKFKDTSLLNLLYKMDETNFKQYKKEIRPFLKTTKDNKLLLEQMGKLLMPLENPKIYLPNDMYNDMLLIPELVNVKQLTTVFRLNVLKGKVVKEERLRDVINSNEKGILLSNFIKNITDDGRKHLIIPIICRKILLSKDISEEQKIEAIGLMRNRSGDSELSKPVSSFFLDEKELTKKTETVEPDFFWRLRIKKMNNRIKSKQDDINKYDKIIKDINAYNDNLQKQITELLEFKSRSVIKRKQLISLQLEVSSNQDKVWELEEMKKVLEEQYKKLNSDYTTLTKMKKYLKYKQKYLELKNKSAF